MQHRHCSDITKKSAIRNNKTTTVKYSARNEIGKCVPYLVAWAIILLIELASSFAVSTKESYNREQHCNKQKKKILQPKDIQTKEEMYLCSNQPCHRFLAWFLKFTRNQKLIQNIIGLALCNSSSS